MNLTPKNEGLKVADAYAGMSATGDDFYGSLPDDDGELRYGTLPFEITGRSLLVLVDWNCGNKGLGPQYRFEDNLLGI